MEYGLIPTIDQYAQNNDVMMRQVQPSNEIASLNNETKGVDNSNISAAIEEAKNINSSEVSETNTISQAQVSEFKEVVLTNLDFGYNDSSKDFYVKITRGDAEYQYPTDDMMKLKAYYLEQAQE